MKVRKRGYWVMLAVTVLLTLAAISTLIPVATVSKSSMLGYKAHCTFTPVSTAICIVLAGVVCSVRRRVFTSREPATKT